MSCLQGASIIRMLESFLGSETFMAGLRLYLRQHQYSNAETSDLWSAMTKQVAMVMGSIVSAVVSYCC